MTSTRIRLFLFAAAAASMSLAGSGIARAATLPSLYFDFSEGSGSTITDSQSGAQGVISPVGGGRFDTTGGKFGGALYFDLPNTKAYAGHLNFAQFVSDFDLSSEGSISFFTNHQNIGKRQVYINGGDVDVQLRHSNEPFSEIDAKLAYTPNGTDVTAGQWEHVVVTWDGSGSKVFLNGNQVAANATASTPTTLGQTLRVGRWLSETLDGSFGSRSLDGAIDDLAFYNKALDATEIGSIGTSSAAGVALANQVAYWNLDNPAGTLEAPKTAGTTSASLIVGKPTTGLVNFAPGAGPIVGGNAVDALDFSGSSELSRVVIKDSADTDFDKTDGTVMMWVKIDAGAPNRQAFLKTTDESLELGIRDDGKLFAAANDDNDELSLGSIASKTRTSSISPVQEQWTHIAFVWDELSGKMDFYVNGVLDAAATGGVGSWTIPNSADWVLGNDPSVVSRHFNGMMAQFAVFDRVLTDAEINLAMTSGPMAVPEPSACLLASVAAMGLMRASRRRRSK